MSVIVATEVGRLNLTTATGRCRRFKSLDKVEYNGQHYSVSGECFVPKDATEIRTYIHHMLSDETGQCPVYGTLEDIAIRGKVVSAIQKIRPVAWEILEEEQGLASTSAYEQILRQIENKVGELKRKTIFELTERDLEELSGLGGDLQRVYERSPRS